MQIETSLNPTTRNNNLQKTPQKGSNSLLEKGALSPGLRPEDSPASHANNARMTAVGELVYQRQALDFKAMNKI